MVDVQPVPPYPIYGEAMGDHPSHDSDEITLDFSDAWRRCCIRGAAGGPARGSRSTAQQVRPYANVSASWRHRHRSTSSLAPTRR